MFYILILGTKIQPKLYHFLSVKVCILLEKMDDILIFRNEKYNFVNFMDKNGACTIFQGGKEYF